MTRIRRKGVALVHTRKGFLVVAGRRKIFALPGGGAEKRESRKKAAIRELREETGLRTKRSKYLFSYHGKIWRDSKGRLVRNHAKVFLLETYGRLRPRNEIKYVAWYTQGSKLRVSNSTKKLIEKHSQSQRKKKEERRE